MPIGPAGQPLPYANEGASPEQIIRSMLDLAQEYRQVEQDDEDLLALEKVTTLLQTLLANNQKQVDQAMGGTFNPSLMRKLSG